MEVPGPKPFSNWKQPTIPPGRQIELVMAAAIFTLLVHNFILNQILEFSFDSIYSSIFMGIMSCITIRSRIWATIWDPTYPLIKWGLAVILAADLAGFVLQRADQPSSLYLVYAFVALFAVIFTWLEVRSLRNNRKIQNAVSWLSWLLRIASRVLRFCWRYGVRGLLTPVWLALWLVPFFSSCLILGSRIAGYCLDVWLVWTRFLDKTSSLMEGWGGDRSNRTAEPSTCHGTQFNGKVESVGSNQATIGAQPTSGNQTLRGNEPMRGNSSSSSEGPEGSTTREGSPSLRGVLKKPQSGSRCPYTSVSLLPANRFLPDTGYTPPRIVEPRIGVQPPQSYSPGVYPTGDMYAPDG